MNISSLIETKPNPRIPNLAPGDTVKVSVKVVEGEKERIQMFQGVVIRIRRRGAGASFTVRRVSYGVGVERTFPFLSPLVDKVEVVRHGKVRRAKLYYLRGLSGKASRIKEKRGEREELLVGTPAEVEETPAAAPAAEAPAAEAPTAEAPAAEAPADVKKET